MGGTFYPPKQGNLYNPPKGGFSGFLKDVLGTRVFGPLGPVLLGKGKSKNAYPKPGKSTLGATVSLPSSSGGFRQAEESKSDLYDLYKQEGFFDNPYDMSGDAGDNPYAFNPNDPFGLAGLFASGGGESASDRAARLKAEQATRTAGGLLDMISSGSYRQPYTQMRDLLAKYVAGAQGDISSAYGGARTGVEKAFATNPYEGLTGTATEVQPALMDLLQSQGASTDPLSQLVAANREAAAQRAAATTDLYKNLGAGYRERGTQALAALDTMQGQSLLDLLSQAGAYGQGISSQESSALKELQKSLSEAASEGADLQSLVRQRISKPKSGKGKKGKK